MLEASSSSKEQCDFSELSLSHGHNPLTSYSLLLWVTELLHLMSSPEFHVQRATWTRCTNGVTFPMRISSVRGHASFSHQTLLSKQKFKHKIKNLKTAPIEHWSQDGVLLNAEPWALGRLHAREARLGRKALEMGGGLANATPTCRDDSVTQCWPTTKCRSQQSLTA